jgi:flavin reductase (DIM6/NTAB) family NADH-FMN oxidoreductase RutF
MQQQIDAQALFKIQYGMYIITSKLGDKLNGQIATTLTQVTSDPIQIAVTLSKKTLTHEIIMHSKVFGASVLSQDAPMAFIGRFGYRCGRDFAKCDGISYEQNITGVPMVLEHALVVLEAQVTNAVDVGTHTIFIGNLLSNKKIKDDTAMTYEYYHTVIKGKSPENAPTYIKKGT